MKKFQIYKRKVRIHDSFDKFKFKSDLIISLFVIFACA